MESRMARGEARPGAAGATREVVAARTLAQWDGQSSASFGVWWLAEARWCQAARSPNMSIVLG